MTVCGRRRRAMAAGVATALTALGAATWYSQPAAAQSFSDGDINSAPVGTASNLMPAIGTDPVTLNCLINKARAEHCLQPLGLDAVLNQVAQGHANDMAAMQVMQHAGSNGMHVDWRLDQTSWDNRWAFAGENIAVGYNEGLGVVRAWLNSTSHRANMLNGTFEVEGLAFNASGLYWDQTLVVPNFNYSVVINDCANVRWMTLDAIDIPEIRDRFPSSAQCTSPSLIQTSPSSAISVEQANPSTVNGASSLTGAAALVGDDSADNGNTASAASVDAAPSSASPASAAQSGGSAVAYTLGIPTVGSDGQISYVYNPNAAVTAPSAQAAYQYLMQTQQGGALSNSSTGAVSDASTDAVSDASTDAVSDASTNSVSDAATDAVSDASTDASNAAGANTDNGQSYGWAIPVYINGTYQLYYALGQDYANVGEAVQNTPATSAQTSQAAYSIDANAMYAPVVQTTNPDGTPAYSIDTAHPVPGSSLLGN